MDFDLQYRVDEDVSDEDDDGDDDDDGDFRKKDVG